MEPMLIVAGLLVQGVLADIVRARSATAARVYIIWNSTICLMMLVFSAVLRHSCGAHGVLLGHDVASYQYVAVLFLV